MKIQLYKKIFNETLSHYLELSSIEGNQSVSSVYSNTSSIAEFPTICHFIADFEILTEKALSKAEYEMFCYIYLEENDKAIKEYKKAYGKKFRIKLENLECKLGKIYKKNNLYPLVNYILPTHHAIQ